MDGRLRNFYIINVVLFLISLYYIGYILTDGFTFLLPAVMQ
jgi:hypothetical protein